MKTYEEYRRFKLKTGQPDFEVRSLAETHSDSDSAWPLLNQVAKRSRGEPTEPAGDWLEPDTVDFGDDERRRRPDEALAPAEPAPRFGEPPLPVQAAPAQPRVAPGAPEPAAPILRLRRARAAADGRHHPGGLDSRDLRNARGGAPLRSVRARAMEPGYNGTPLKALLKSIADGVQHSAHHPEGP